MNKINCNMCECICWSVRMNRPVYTTINRTFGSTRMRKPSNLYYVISATVAKL